ncbi:MAG: UDP-N-acetylglucosamine diphosphorylase [Clostridia bacterium]|nr:UDP-N-acetylglucosamine diphosphorylase [Clostridia bacterium]
MDYIVFKKDFHEFELIKLNIFIDEFSNVCEGTKIFSGSKIVNSTIGANCEIGRNSIIVNSKIAKGVKIESSYLNDCEVEEETTIGPFATIKKQSKIGLHCRIGNFVEIKNSVVGGNTKIAHLAYVGDCEIGENCNIGCGVVFCNYNGRFKFKSVVGDYVFIGSNVNIIAPVKIEDEAYIAAGSTITKDVSKSQFAIARENQTNKNNFDNPYIKNKNE